MQRWTSSYSRQKVPETSSPLRTIASPKRSKNAAPQVISSYSAAKLVSDEQLGAQAGWLASRRRASDPATCVEPALSLEVPKRAAIMRFDVANAPGKGGSMVRGRTADTPSAIPALRWRDILRRMWERFDNEHILLISAGIAFYGLLAFVPALAALVAIYGPAFDPAQVVTQV